MLRFLLTSFSLLLFLFVLPPASAQESDFIENLISNLDATGSRDVFFDLDTGVEVDSSSADWDLWFNGSRIKVNGQLAMVDKKYSSVYAAPDTGYLDDEMGITAFPSGSDAGWFMYDPNTHTVEAVPQRTFVIKNRDGNHAKVEFISYYKDATPADTPGADPRYYTFRYKMNSSGSSKL
ncbi:MAG: hypothetical protein HKN43_10945 [Rhodothermales bacterium]|nr:hypothetical protein [Rhodothermales bacterium]